MSQVRPCTHPAAAGQRLQQLEASQRPDLAGAAPAPQQASLVGAEVLAGLSKLEARVVQLEHGVRTANEAWPQQVQAYVKESEAKMQRECAKLKEEIPGGRSFKR